ncbi:hypothetical protein QE152_g13195 [Popillia japonica]|uniref:Uncharacterized protein n=1 Tax=Popillia japonica TaxID=7064 RepID=A0AAW1LG25_POPJA
MLTFTQGGDAACKEHDIAYSQNKDLSSRHRADLILENKAWSRVKSKDASVGEKAAAWSVTNAMKIKRKIGIGLKKKKKQAFRKSVVVKAKDVIKKFKGNVKEGAKLSLSAAKLAVKAAGGKKRIRSPRIIPIPKHGGVLPLIPLFAGLSAIGSLAGGAAGIATAVNKAKAAQKKLAESQRHNKMMEDIALKDKDIIKFAKDIPHFRGVFMRDSLPKIPYKNECAVINLDSVKNSGTHWVCYCKEGNTVHYFDSFW